MEELLARARAGDTAAEERLFQHLLVRFELLAKRRVRDGETARDIAQESCMAVFSKYKAEESINNFAAWTYGVLRMKIGNHIQKDKTERKVVSAGSDIESIAGNPCEIGHELKNALLACLKKVLKVRTQYARALNLCHLGYGTDEVCERLGVNRGNLYVILNRGRAVLKQCLDKGRG